MKNLKRIIGMFSVLSFVGINASLATTGIVNTPAARVREKASTDSEIIKNIYEDDEVEIIEESGDWYKIKVDGKTGYVSKSLIKTLDKTNKNDSSNKNITTDNDKTNTTNENNNTVNKNTNTNTEKTNSENNTENNVSNYTTENTTNIESKTVISKDTTLKLLPNFGSNDLRFLDQNTEIKIEKELGKWVKVSLSDNSIGWVLKSNTTDKIVEEPENEEESANTTAEATNTVVDKKEENTVTNEVQVETKNIKGRINVETANVRAKASTDSEIIGKLDEGAEIDIIEETGDWYKISTSKISSGYVSKSLVKVSSSDVSSRGIVDTREEIVETPSVENTTTVSTNKDSVVQTAKQYLGYSYVSGGKNPESGFDCSGFTGYIFKQFGYTLGATAASQDSVGQAVERESLQPGDLILFQDEGRTKIGHTGIYIGNNEFIHAANAQRGVVIDNLSTNSYYNERYVGARRIVE